MEVLGEIHRKKKQSRSEELKGIQDILENYRNTGTELAWKSVNGSLVDDSKTELESLRKKAESLKSDKFPITYKDYPTTSEDSGWVDQIKASFTDPKYRIATTLGQFTASEDGKGNVILEDRYDWTSPENTTASEYLKSIPAALNSPERLGNLAIRAFKPKVAREVRIVIPKGE